MVSGEFITVIAAIAVTATMMIPAIISRRIKHGEARFDSETGKRIDKE